MNGWDALIELVNIAADTLIFILIFAAFVAFAVLGGDK